MLAFYWLSICHPDRAGPRQFSVLLLDANVIPMRALAGAAVAELEVHVFLGRRGLVDVGGIPDQVHGLHHAGAAHLHPDRKDLRRSKVLAHKMIAEAEFENNVVSGAVSPPGFDGIEDRLPAQRGSVYHRVRN